MTATRFVYSVHAGPSQIRRGMWRTPVWNHEGPRALVIAKERRQRENLAVKGIEAFQLRLLQVWTYCPQKGGARGRFEGCLEVFSLNFSVLDSHDTGAPCLPHCSEAISPAEAPL